MIFFDINTINIPPDLIIDGKKITSKKNCFSFFASFLGVENQYINNWDALFDSLRDFDISIYNSFTIKIINSDILLCTENEKEKTHFALASVDHYAGCDRRSGYLRGYPDVFPDGRGNFACRIDCVRVGQNSGEALLYDGG